MCNERPEIEGYKAGVVIPAMVGHIVIVLDKEFRVLGQGKINWETGEMLTETGMKTLQDGWYLVHHPERCHG